MENRRRTGDAVIDQLKQEFDNHRVDMLTLSNAFDQHVRDERDDRKENQRVQRQNAENISNLTVAVTDLTKTVQSHIETTAPIVDKYRDYQGAARVSDDILDRMAKWSKVGGALSVVAAVMWWVLEHLPKH